MLSKIKWIHMIIDEGHRLKNVKSKLSQTLNEYYSTRYRLILTGTPLQVSDVASLDYVMSFWSAKDCLYGFRAPNHLRIR